MDPLPQLPASAALNDSAGTIRDVFQEYLERPPFPTALAGNVRVYAVDDNLSLKEAAKSTLQVRRSLEEESQAIRGAELDIVRQHADLVLRRRAETDFLREMMRMRPCDVFASLCLPDKLKFGLLDKCDLFPDVARQFLDFRFNPSLHRCRGCFPTRAPLPQPASAALPKAGGHARPPPGAPTLLLQPPQVVFLPDSPLEASFQIRNVGTRVQRVSVRALPTLPHVFQLGFAPSSRLAPGMCLKGTVRFTPSSSKNLQDRAQFCSGRTLLTLRILSRQPPPQLQGFVCRAPSGLPPAPAPAPAYSLRRQRALNDSIDFGSCFATNHVPLSLLLTNRGAKARFFWLTEEEFRAQDVQSATRSLETSAASFWVYPSFFELRPGETCEVLMLFQPVQPGLHTLPMRLMCDNHTYRPIELIGDAVCFDADMLEVAIPQEVASLQTRPGYRLFLGYRRAAVFTLRVSNRSALPLGYRLEMGAWMRVSNQPPQRLAPHSPTELRVSCECPPEAAGLYSAQLKLFVLDVPVACVHSPPQRAVHLSVPTALMVLQPVDVQVVQVEVAGFAPLSPETVPPPQAAAGRRPPPPPTAHLEFCPGVLDFGVLPVGADVSKTFAVHNLGPLAQAWHIEELQYHLDSPPYASLAAQPPISQRRGGLRPRQTLHLSYRLRAKPPGRGVSVLVLLTPPPAAEAHSICVVTYEVVVLDVQVTASPQTSEAILCPMRMLYVGVPEALTLELRNRSLIPAPFHFMGPVGADAAKLRVDYQPLAGELKGGGCRKVRLEVTCFEVGILERVTLPCFIGPGQAPLQVRLLCLVDCLHVFFHLPGHGGKVLWPPKVICELGGEWSGCCLCGEEAPPEEEAPSQEGGALLAHSLLSADSEFLLQESVVEVRGVPTGTARKVRMYVENLTPKGAKYAVQTTNYPAAEGGGPWRRRIQRHGLVVHPDKERGWLTQHQLLPLDFWVYSCTWGVYCEEVVVDLEGIAPFSFSLLVEVVGGPLELPLATGGATVRWGPVSSAADTVSREILMKNASAVGVAVDWVVEGAGGLEVAPGGGGAVGAGAHLRLPVQLAPAALSVDEDQQELRWALLGRVTPKDPMDRLQSGYFLREAASLRIEVRATLVRPQLQAEMLGECPLRLYANQVALGRSPSFPLQCLLKNPTACPLEVELECSEPLSVGPAGPKLLLAPRQCRKVQVECLLSHERILKGAAQVYREEAQPPGEEQAQEEHKLLTLHPKLELRFGGGGGGRQVMPVDVMVYYPHIQVRPAHLKFGYVLLGRTQKASLTIYNLTGYEVLFEVYKTIGTQEIFVAPSSGRIAESAGRNRSFSTVNVFFSPRGRRSYQESVRIVTNIPQYYVDVPVKGAGSFNEKFD